MEKVYDYLYKNDDIEPDKLLKNIVKKFKLDILDATRIYRKWKDEYMKPVCKVKENRRKPFRIK